ncbi:NACHT domain-containing protein [Lysinibacillus xylanilyticus]|uniref:Uncharacterized protein n=1 Tax=Lysinibacillus xylanilyticus TaxID=582475 RepID=A0A2M9Q6W2_9BACI|nr:NACHT domain-containing protein [Lysinibacillus xylanilyticus]PJO43821.1 hypothetical protein CWD94_10235 [Lysinibacillus xylanilyticus]
MNTNLDIVKNVAPVLTPFISSVVEVWIKPKLQELYKKNKLFNNLYENAFEDKFKDYLKRAYERNNVMNTIVFQNRPKSLEDLYVPLTLRSSHSSEEILINKYQEDFVNKYKKFVITDSAGMGKSTLLKRMFTDSMKSNVGVPIFIELRKLSSTNKLIDEIFKELNPIDDEFDRSFVLNLIEKGDFIFFLDGYDEIPLEHRINVTVDLQSFISKASDNIFILSSRPQSAIASFADFYEFKIKPLEINEAFALLKKYDETNTLAEQIINIISKDKNSENLKEFLINPLMVSLLFKGYEYKQTISYKKSIFYRQVYDALYENHDLTKGGAFVHEKLSGLDIEEFHAVLRIAAYLTWKVGKVEYDRDEIIKFLTKARSYTNIKFMESKFLEDLVANVPLFYKEGNLYRWKHKSLQEYFSAQYICTDSKDLQEKILSNIYSSLNFDSYLNVIDLCYDIDYKTFRRSIIYKFVCEALNYDHENYKYFNEIKRESLLKRKQLTCRNRYFILTNVNLDRNDTKDDHGLFFNISREGETFVQNNYYEMIKEYEINSITHSNNDNGVVLHYEKINNKILDLFYSKGENFIEIANDFESEDISFEINKIIKPTTETHCQMINDNPSSIFNQKENFELINQLIINTIELSDFYIINFDKLREIKKEIEREKDALKEDELSLF